MYSVTDGKSRVRLCFLHSREEVIVHNVQVMHLAVTRAHMYVTGNSCTRVDLRGARAITPVARFLLQRAHAH